MLVAVWFLVTSAGFVDSVVLPSPLATLDQFRVDITSSEFWSAFWSTVSTAAISLAAGMAASMVIAVLLFALPSVYELVRPFLIFFNAMPRLVLVPFFVLFFGLGGESAVAVAVSLVIVPAIFGLHNGFYSHSLEKAQSIRIMGGSRRHVWSLLILPSALPSILAAVRLSFALALLGVVVTEMLILPWGIGSELRFRAEVLDVSGVFSMVIVIVLLSIAVNTLLDRLRGRWTFE